MSIVALLVVASVFVVPGVSVGLRIFPSAPQGIADLLDRTDLIYGSEIGSWRTTGAPATDPSTPIPALVKAAKIPLIRFAVYDVFSDMTDPAGQRGTQSRAKFDAAINSIRSNLDAEVIIKLLPISRDPVDTKPGSLYCPPLNDLGRNLDYYRAIVAQAGSRVRMYESSNEMEYDCYQQWGFASAGVPGVSTALGIHFAENMPALKKYARSLGFEIATVGYLGTPGGFGWGDTVDSPRLSNAVEFLTATHDAYVASGDDPDYIPDAISIHAYPYSGDFCDSTPLWSCDVPTSDIIAYYDAWTAGVRQAIDAIWGPTVGPAIKLAVSEWNAGAEAWGGFSDSRVDGFYSAFLAMLKRNGYWFANQFALASNGSQPYDMITESGQTRSFYDVFKAASTGAGAPVSTTTAPPPPTTVIPRPTWVPPTTSPTPSTWTTLPAPTTATTRPTVTTRLSPRSIPTTPPTVPPRWSGIIPAP